MEEYIPPTVANTYTRNVPYNYKPPTEYAAGLPPVMLYRPPNLQNPLPDPLLGPPYNIGDSVKFRYGREEEKRELGGVIKNIQYTIQPDGTPYPMTIELQNILGREYKSKGGRTYRKRRNRRRSRRR